MMKPYKGYAGSVSFDEDDMVFHGKIEGIRAIVTYEATTAEGLVEAFRAAVDDYLDYCQRAGDTPEVPFSGEIAVKAEPELHKRAAAAAERRAQTLNEWVVETLRERLSHDDSIESPAE